MSVVRLLFIRFLRLSLLDFSVAKCLLLLSWSVASLRESLLTLAALSNVSLGAGFVLIRVVCLHVSFGRSSRGSGGKLCVQEQ